MPPCITSNRTLNMKISLLCALHSTGVSHGAKRAPDKRHVRGHSRHTLVSLRANAPTCTQYASRAPAPSARAEGTYAHTYAVLLTAFAHNASRIKHNTACSARAAQVRTRATHLELRVFVDNHRARNDWAGDAACSAECRLGSDKHVRDVLVFAEQGQVEQDFKRLGIGCQDDEFRLAAVQSLGSCTGNT